MAFVKLMPELSWFAIFQVGSHQFKISPGDCIYTEKLKFADVNDKVVDRYGCIIIWKKL